jgi:hypothetical protein
LTVRSYRLGLRPATPSHRGEAKQAGAKQCDSRRLWNCGREFGDHDLAVTGLEIGDQDLIYAGVEGTPTAATTVSAAAATTAKAAAPSTSPKSTAASASTKAPVPAANGGTASRKIWEGAAAPSGEKTDATSKFTVATTTDAEEATAPAATAEERQRTAPTDAPEPSLPAATSAAPQTTISASGAAALAGATSATSAAASAPTARTGDNQRHVIATDHEGATATTTSHTRTARTAYADIERLALHYGEVAANLGPQPP